MSLKILERERESKRRATFWFGIAVLTLASLSLLICVVFFLLPLLSSIFVVLFARRSEVSAKAFNFAFSRIVSIFLFTTSHAFFSALLSLGIGFPLAFFCANRNFALKKILLSLSAIPFTLPPLIIALAYILFFGNNGLVVKVLRDGFHLSVSSFLYSFAGIVVVQGMYNFPIAMQEISESWQRVPKHEEEAATLLGASPFFIFRTITVPHILPAILCSFLLIFLFCFFSFVIVLMFGGVGVSTIEVELYKCARQGMNARPLGSFFLIEFAFAYLLVCLHTYFNKRLDIEGIEVDNREAKTMSRGERGVFSFLLLTVFVFLILPLLSIFLFSFQSNKTFSSFTSVSQGFFNLSFATWTHIFSSLLFWRSFFSSFYIGLCTTIVSLLSAIFYTFCKVFLLDSLYTARSGSLKSSWLDILPFLPLATSSVMLGTGWHFASPRPSYFQGIVLLICCQSSLYWPFVQGKINIALKTAVPENLISASLLLSQSRVQTFFYIVLPLIFPSLKASVAIVFAMSIADASLPLVLGVEGFSSLSLLLFDYASSYRFAESAAIGTLLIILSSCQFFLKFKKKKRQLS